MGFNGMPNYFFFFLNFVLNVYQGGRYGREC